MEDLRTHRNRKLVANLNATLGGGGGNRQVEDELELGDVEF